MRETNLSVSKITRLHHKNWSLLEGEDQIREKSMAVLQATIAFFYLSICKGAL